MTATTAAIENPSGSVTVYRKDNKLGPMGRMYQTSLKCTSGLVDIQFEIFDRMGCVFHSKTRGDEAELEVAEAIDKLVRLESNSIVDLLNHLPPIHYAADVVLSFDVVGCNKNMVGRNG